MKNHIDLTDQQFETQFSACSLDPGLFSHEAHLRLAWIHITRYGISTAIDNITSQLQAFVASLGAAEKSNATVTVAAVRGVYHFMLKSDTRDFKSFISENPRLKNNFRDLLGAHYKTDIFNSEHAKKAFLQPELAQFD